MATGPHAFYSLWQDSSIRERLFELLSKEDICAVRRANSACCNLVTKRLFLRTHLTFTANTFTNPLKIQALSRIGHHIEHLTFHFAHSNSTFLPPLIHPDSGREICFLYSPHTSMASVLARPKYANTELEEILTQQYPPLFHAASNVPSFMNAIQHMTNLRHLTIKTPGQDPKERYRRDIVDYALISLRISLERTPLKKLTKLSLSGVHPASFNYLRFSPGGFGASPTSSKRIWRQIRKLHISVESWDFYGPSPGLDHLKIIDDYIRCFAPQLEKFAFTWTGRKGPCPIALSGDPLFAPPRNTKKLFNEVTSPMSPLPARPSRRPLTLPKLRTMSIRNATMNESQLRTLVANHKRTVREFDFDNVVLINGGSWEEALAPLREPSGSGNRDVWRHSNVSGGSELGFPWRRPGTAGSGSGVVSSQGDETIPEGSAAAAAASKELFDVDLDGMVFGGANDAVDVEALEAGVEQWALGVTAPFETIPETKEEVEEPKQEADDGGLASDIEAAKEASLAFSTRLRKRRIRKRKSHRHHGKDGSEDEERTERRSQRSESRERGKRHESRSRHKHSRSDDSSDRHRSRDRGTERSQSRRGHHGHHHRRHHSEELPEMPSMPEVIGTDDEAFYRPRTPTKEHREQQDQQDELVITPPIHAPEPFPVLLQPTVYDPSATAGPFVSSPVSNPSLSSSPSSLTRQSHDGLSTVQRVIEADLLAEAKESAARSSALKRAKEMVLAKLSKEFNPYYSSSSNTTGGGGGHRRKLSKGGGGIQDSAAVLASAGLASALNLPPPQQMAAQQTASSSAAHLGIHPAFSSANVNLAMSSSSSSTGMMGGVGARLRGGLFGRSMANVVQCSSNGAVYTNGGDSYHGSSSRNTGMTNLSNKSSMDARSVMVPLIISR
ncbi:hypothetical protein QBC37DRAFT_283138 [Rhypophila decipiens]|uniref:Uncharacterized protein n=1 Tax=Rhypophila decipiens TaxID=261697 RepID=A0AAN6Y949_9PEZI|nr:hypothetical protein QBC37DRAFT_283138 [Rhypophila decipiens]